METVLYFMYQKKTVPSVFEITGECVNKMFWYFIHIYFNQCIRLCQNMDFVFLFFHLILYILQKRSKRDMLTIHAIFSCTSIAKPAQSPGNAKYTTFAE